MKRTLSILAVLGIVSVIGIPSADAAFSWNPAHWFGHGCNKCEKVQKPDCGCPNVEPTCPVATGGAAPCDPCSKQIITPTQPCDACDRLQQEMKK